MKVRFTKILFVHVSGEERARRIQFHRFVELPIAPVAGTSVREHGWFETVAAVAIVDGEIQAETLAIVPMSHVKTEEEIAAAIELHRPSGYEGPE